LTFCVRFCAVCPSSCPLLPGLSNGCRMYFLFSTVLSGSSPRPSTFFERFCVGNWLVSVYPLLQLCGRILSPSFRSHPARAPDRRWFSFFCLLSPPTAGRAVFRLRSPGCQTRRFLLLLVPGFGRVQNTPFCKGTLPPPPPFHNQIFSFLLQNSSLRLDALSRV